MWINYCAQTVSCSKLECSKHQSRVLTADIREDFESHHQAHPVLRCSGHIRFLCGPELDTTVFEPSSIGCTRNHVGRCCRNGFRNTALSERLYLFLVGASILLALYLENVYLICALSAVLLLEGVSGMRMTTMIRKARHISLDHDLIVADTKVRFEIDGLSAWRVFVAIVLVSSHALMHEDGYEVFWFIPWFMGFAIMGAGATGLCPVLLGLHRVGFK